MTAQQSAKRMRDRFPTRLIYVLADVGNGEQEANEAAYKIGAQIAVPSFTDEQKASFRNSWPLRQGNDSQFLR